MVMGHAYDSAGRAISQYLRKKAQSLLENNFYHGKTFSNSASKLVVIVQNRFSQLVATFAISLE